MPFQTEVKRGISIEIYQFKIYDIVSDETLISKRWGTEAGIQSVCGRKLDETKHLVDPSVVDMAGLTEKGYMPEVN